MGAPHVPLEKGQHRTLFLGLRKSLSSALRPGQGGADSCKEGNALRSSLLCFLTPTAMVLVVSDGQCVAFIRTQETRIMTI